MATRYAVASGNFSNTAIWDNGAVPLSTDDIYSNGFSIAVDQNINAVSLRSTQSNVYLPNMSIPAMTGNTLPEGICFANVNLGTAWQAFDQNSSTSWQTSTSPSNIGYIGYKFSSGKIIKRYYFTGTSYAITSFKFQGSFDDITYVDLDVVSSTSVSTYTSPILSNTTAYTYYRLNILATGLNNPAIIQRLEMTESTGIVYGTGTGGSFDVSVARDITLTGSPSLYTANSTTGTINITATTGTVNITASNGLTNVNVGSGRCVFINGTATVNITGDCNQGTTAVATAIRVASTGIINYTGNITSGAQGSGSSNVVEIANICTFNIIGNINGHSSGSGTIAHYPIILSANATLNVTGILNSYLGLCIGSASSSTINITGAITANSTATAISNTGAGAVNVISGIITSSTSSTAITSSGVGLVTVGNSPLINTSNVMAVNAIRIRLYSPASIQWQFQDNLGGTKTLYSAGGSVGLPLTTNVRSGIVYGASNELTGTMVVPINANVRKGVQVDVQPNVGTADLTAEDIFNAISTSTNPVAIRLKNISTVQTTGDQIVSLT